jgi:xanthine dehydrogenase accessory factor
MTPPLVVGLGPGFTAGTDVDAVVETKRGAHTGGASYGKDRPLPTPVFRVKSRDLARSGLFEPLDRVFLKGYFPSEPHVQKGDIVAHVDDMPVPAPISGMLRGLLHDGITVTKDLKSGDVDPRDVEASCWIISDKALAIGGGVLEAILAAMKYQGALASNKFFGRESS